MFFVIVLWSFSWSFFRGCLRIFRSCSRLFFVVCSSSSVVLVWSFSCFSFVFHRFRGRFGFFSLVFFFVFKCSRLFATSSKPLRFQSFLPRVLLQKSQHAICKIQFRNAFFHANRVFKKTFFFLFRTCNLYQAPRFFKNLGNIFPTQFTFSKRNYHIAKKSEMQFLARISVILPKPRFVQNFENDGISWQIAFERKNRFVAKTSNMRFFQGVR